VLLVEDDKEVAALTRELLGSLGLTFIHVASVESSEKNPLTSLPSFKAFQAQLKDRCVEPPVVTDVSIVGSYIGSDSEVAS